MTTETYNNTDPREKLYNTVKGKGYYTKSFEEFKTQYSTPEQIEKIYSVVNGKKLYTKSKDEFIAQYFPQPVKKKESGVSPLPSSGEVSTNDLDAIKAYTLGTTVEEVKANKQVNMKPPAKITNAITQTKDQKPSAKSVKQEAEHKLSQISDDDLVDPIKGINKLSQANPTNPKDILATEKAKEMLVGRMAQDGFDAKELLSRSFFGLADDENQTSKVLREKAADYDKSVAPLRNIQVGDLTDATPEYLDNDITPQIKNAAIKYGAQKDPQFAKEIQALGLDLNDPILYGKVGSFKTGQWVQNFLQDENVGTFLNKENPNLLPAIDRAYKQIRVDNQDYGINSVANEVSQAVQKSGFNNIDPIVNFYGDNHKAYADQIARQIYKDDPQSLAIWDKHIKDNQEQYMDAPSLMQGFAEGGEGVYKGIANTFTEPFRNVSESTKRRWSKEALNVSANPEGIFKIIRETGRVGGLVWAIGGVGNVLGAGGTGMYAQKIVPALSGGVLPFFGDSLEEGRAKYPDSPIKAGLSALVNTTMYAALSQQLFPAKSINQAISKVSPDINNIVERLTSGQISREAARQQANTAFKRALDFTLGSTGKAGKITAELTAITQFNKGLDKIMMDEEEFKNYHPERDESEETITLFLSNIALGGFSKFGDMKKRNRVAEESYYELASNPKKYERMIDNLSVDKSFGTIQEFKENLKFISGIKTELDALRINPKDQKRFIFEALKEKSAKETSESASDSSVQQKNKDVIKRAKEVKEKILAGEDAETIITESEQKDIDKQKETELDIQRLTIDNELDNKKFDKQREELDGRNPDDKIKIEKIEEDRRRANEDFKIEMEKLKPTQKLPGIYGDLYKSNPESVLKDIAEQAQGIDAEGNPLEGGSRKPDMIKQGFSEEIIDEAIKKYPATQKETQASEGAAENVVPSTFDLRQRYLDDFNIVEDSSFDWRVTSQLSTSDRKKAVADIKAGKETAATKKLEQEIKEAQERGTVIINRGRGNQAETVEIPINEWFGLDQKEQNKIFEDADKLDENTVRMINESDITLQNIDNLKHLFNGFPYEQSDFTAIKDYLTRQGKRSTQTSEAGESGQAQKAVIETKAEDTKDTFQAEKESPINAEPNKEGSGAGEGETLRLSHADTEQIYKEAGLPERLSTPTKHREQLDKEVDEMLSKGYDFDKVADEVMAGKRQFEDKDQVAFARKVADLKAKQKGLDIKSPEFDALQTEIEKLSRASDVAGTLSGRALQSRKDYVPVEETISDFIINEKEVTKSDILTDQQKETVQKEFNDIKKAEQAWKDKYEALKAEHEKSLAEKEVKKTAATAKKSTTRDFKKERDSFREELKAAKEKHEKWLKDQGIQKSGAGFTLTTDMAKAIAKIAKSHVEEGVTKLAEVVKKTIDDVKDIFGDISEKDVMDVLAGKYNEKKKPRKELAIQMQDLKTEVQLIEKLDKILNGEEPKSEKGKQQRNKQITELRNKIKDIRGFESEKKKEEQSNVSQKAKTAKELEVDLNRAEKELAAEEARKAKAEEIAQKKAERDTIRAEVKAAKEAEKAANYKTPEQRALASLKTKMANEIAEIQEQIRTGDFAKEEKKEPVPLDAEAIKLKDELIKVKNERKLRQLKEFYANQSNYEKGVRAAIEIANIPRALMATLDFSALLRQAIIPTIARPRTALRIEKGKFEGSVAEMFRGAASQKLYDRWFSDLAESPRFEGMKKSDLAITDSTDPNLQAREEAFMSGLADKIPLVGKTLIKGSERAYSMGLNKIRVDLYNRFADAMEERGLTVENSPKQYKEMAAYINNSTGRGDIGKTLNTAAPILNALFFSPRLIASRVNMLTYLAQPRFYKTVPKEVRKAYYRDMAKFIGLGITVLALAKLGGADVEDDPRSSDFGKIKSGNTRWDIWGGFQQYARVFAQMITGEKKSANTGEIQELDGEGRFGTTRGDVVTNFGRGKLAPVPSMMVDVLGGRTIMGEKLTTDWKADEDKEIGLGRYLGQHFLPLNATGLAESMKDQGVKALFTVGVPATFGIGVQTYEAKTPSSTKNSKPTKPKKPQKPTKND